MKQRRLTFAVLIVVLAGGLVPAGERSASAGPPPQSVNVTNTSADPVPVTSVDDPALNGYVETLNTGLCPPGTTRCKTPPSPSRVESGS